VITPEVLENLQRAYREFCQTILTIEPLYKSADENFRTLAQWLRSQNIPEAEWCSQHIWSAAFVACKAAGTLEFDLSDVQKQAARTAELSARDLEESLRNRHAAEETVGQTLHRIFQEQAESTRAEIEAAKKEAAARKAKLDSESDLSVVPSAQRLAARGRIAPS